MARPLLWLSFGTCAVLLSTGCLISEQIGQGNQELTFHFDTQFNRAVLFLRSIALVALGGWFKSAAHGRAGPKVIGAVCVAAALFLFVKDYPRLSGYSVQVANDGLHLDIPPGGEKFIEWGSIEEMLIEGFGPVGPKRDAVAQMLDLPEWYTMEIRLADGATHTVNLKLLSLEQRQILWKAIAARARLVSAD